jgi:hypothetical protein
MSINQLIAGGIQLPRFESPMNMMAQLSQLESAREANELRKMQMAQMQRQQEQEMGLMNALQSGQPLSLQQALLGGRTGLSAFELQQGQLEAQRKRAQAERLQRAVPFAVAAQRAVNTPVQSPGESDSLLMGARQELADFGISGPEIDQRFASLQLLGTPEARREGLMTLVSSIPGLEEMLTAQSQKRADVGKTEAETRKLNVETGDVGRVKPTADMLNYRQAQQQGFKGTFMDYQTQLKREGRSQVNVPVTVADRDQGGWMDALRKESDALKSTPGFITSLESARALIPQATTGAGAEVITNVANFARNRLGIEIDPKTVTSEQLRSQLFQGIIANLRQIDAQPTQSQQAALSQAIGTIGSDPRALDNILAFWADLSRARVNEFNRKVDESEKSDFRAPYNPRIKLPEPPSKESLLSPQIKAAIEWAKDPKNANDPTLSAVQDRLRFLGVIE